MEGEVPWAVETSKDGEKWRFFGKAWAKPGEPVILHGAPRFVRVRRTDQDSTWSGPLERNGDHPMSLIRPDEPDREDLWPSDSHIGLPVLLPGGEEGRLLRFEHSVQGDRWTWALEFRGHRPQAAH